MFWKMSRSSKDGSSSCRQFKPAVEQLEARNVLDASGDVVQLLGSVPQLLSDAASGKPIQSDEANLLSEVSALTVDYGTVSKALAQSEALFQELGKNASPSAQVALQNYVDTLRAQRAQAEGRLFPDFLEALQGTVVDAVKLYELNKTIAEVEANFYQIAAQLGPGGVSNLLLQLQTTKGAATVLYASAAKESYEGFLNVSQDITTIQETQQALYQTGTFLQQHPEVLGIPPTNHDSDHDGDQDMY